MLRKAAEEGRAFSVSHRKLTSRSAEGRFLEPTRTCWSISDGNKITGGTQGPAGFPESTEGLFPAVWQEHQALLEARELVRAHTNLRVPPGLLPSREIPSPLWCVGCRGLPCCLCFLVVVEALEGLQVPVGAHDQPAVWERV